MLRSSCWSTRRTPELRPYAADDADHFHGRYAELEDLLDRLRAGEREIYVTGAPDSGKSSLVSAVATASGLAHALASWCIARATEHRSDPSRNFLLMESIHGARDRS